MTANPNAVEGLAWIRWDGGDCPVVAGTLVRLQHRDGKVAVERIDYPTAWRHMGMPCDIVAYQVITGEAHA